VHDATRQGQTYDARGRPSGGGGRHRARLHRHREGLSGEHKGLVLLRKTRYLVYLERNPRVATVTADDRPTTPATLVLDAARSKTALGSLQGRLDGSAWYLLRMHQTSGHRLPGQPLQRAAGKHRAESSPAGLTADATGIAPAVWAGRATRTIGWGVCGLRAWPWLDRRSGTPQVSRIDGRGDWGRARGWSGYLPA